MHNKLTMAASDINPEVGTALCSGHFMEVKIGYRFFNMIRNKFKSLRADRVQMFVNKTQEVPVRVNAIIICANCLFCRP